MKDPLDWKLVSSEYLFRDSWLTARKDTCERPDGTIVTPYYVMEYPNWATALALTEDGKVILVKQYRHAIGRTCMEIPGGCIDDTDASPEAAIRRELLEETGYAFDSFEFLGEISANPSTNNNMMYMFLAKGGKKVQEQMLDHNEEIEVHLVDMAELKGMLRRNEILQSMHVSCIFYGMIRLNELGF